MGDRRKQALCAQFDGKLKLEFHGANITSVAGLLAFRELDEAFRLTEIGTHPSVERKWGDASVQTATLSAAWPFGMDQGQRFARMTTSDAVNGKSRLR